MNRKYAFDVLPSGNLFSELVDFTDTGYFDDQSLGESWQQTCHEMTTYFREEPPEFDDFRQEEPDECGNFFQKERPERGDSSQTEPGECGDLPQKPPECDDLPQEETWAQPPSPPTSPPSLTPTTTYTILTLTCVPLSDSNESTGMSPEDTVMTPQITGISPQITDKSPQITAMLPQMTNISTEKTGISPENTSISPEITSISQEITSIPPQMTSILPQMTSISPQMTSISPQMSGVSTQEIPSPVPVPHAKTNVKPRKSRAIDRRNEYLPLRFPDLQQGLLHTKPFPCTAEGCKWRFARLSCFKRHMLSKHTASKPFRCRFCDKCFARSDSLVKHETVQCSVGLKLQRQNK